MIPVQVALKKEPVAWVTLVIVVGQIVLGLLTHNLDTSLFTSLMTALGGVGIRRTVWSPQTHNEAINHVVQTMANGITKAASSSKSRQTTMTESENDYVIPNPKEFPDGDQLDSVNEDSVATVQGD